MVKFKLLLVLKKHSQKRRLAFKGRAHMYVHPAYQSSQDQKLQASNVARDFSRFHSNQTYVSPSLLAIRALDPHYLSF